jgi:uncharacterized pyridoxamine 5'-phosphate oxidase family protein
LDEENMVHKEYYTAIKKNENVSFAGKRMELEIIMLRERKTKLRKTNIECFHLHAESGLKK